MSQIKTPQLELTYFVHKIVSNAQELRNWESYYDLNYRQCNYCNDLGCFKFEFAINHNFCLSCFCSWKVMQTGKFEIIQTSKLSTNSRIFSGQYTSREFSGDFYNLGTARKNPGTVWSLNMINLDL